MDLSEFLVEITALHDNLRSSLGVKSKPTDVDALYEFDHFKRNDERDWHEVGEEEHPTAPLGEYLIAVQEVHIGMQVVVEVQKRAAPTCSEYGTQQSEQHLGDENGSNDDTHLKLQPAFLLPSLIAVQHDL